MNGKIKKSGNYTALSNEIINDSRLNLRSLGLFLFMWSKPDNWHFTLDNIAKTRNVGRDQIKHAMQQLKRCGYVSYEKQKDGTGVYYLDDKNRQRTIESPKVENPPKAVEKVPKGGKPKGGFSTPLSNTILSNKNIYIHEIHEDFSKEKEEEKWQKLNELLLWLQKKKDEDKKRLANLAQANRKNEVFRENQDPKTTGLVKIV